MKRTIIEEGVYDINSRESIKKAIFTFDGEEITRQLIGYNNKVGRDINGFPVDIISGYGDDKIDRFSRSITKVEILLKDALSDNIDYDSILDKIKSNVEAIKTSYKSNIENEIPFFKNPVIIEEGNINICITFVKIKICCKD